MSTIRFVAALCISLMSPAIALAQTDSTSTQPVRIVVPYAVGGLIDVMNRVMAHRMSQTLGQPVVVENRPGANANIGPALVVQAPPDGRTLLASASYFSSNPLIEAKLQWDPKSLVPVARFAMSPNIMVVPRSSPANTLKELLALAKESPGMPVMDAGRGAPQTMVQEVLQDSAQVRFTPIQYKGGTSHVPDLVAGTLSAGVVPFNVALGLVKNGDLKALAVTSKERSPLLPDVPTMAESGFPEAGIDSWLGFHVPVGTPPDVVRRLVAAVEEAAGDAGVRERLSSLGAQSAFLDTAAFDAFLLEDLTRARRLVRLVNVK